MLVDELYSRLPVGATFYISARTSPLRVVKESESLSFAVSSTQRCVLQPHSLVRVESDRVLITKEQYFDVFPHLASTAC